MALTALSALTEAVKDMQRDVVLEAAARFDELATASAARIVGNGGTMRMHTSRGRKSTPMGTKADNPVGRGATVTVTVRGKPKGPWVWLESGTKEHEIGRAHWHLKLGNDWRIGPIVHKGSRGQKAWSRAVKELKVEFPELAIRHVQKKVNRAG